MEKDKQPGNGDDSGPYIVTDINELKRILAEKIENLRHLVDQRNYVTEKVRMLEEDFQLLLMAHEYGEEEVIVLDVDEDTEPDADESKSHKTPPNKGQKKSGQGNKKNNRNKKGKKRQQK
ncbi:hypothetical protein LSTR_LSTR009805 [Laodelphax striatellus]|uniref:Uncharacterized protein n=1 Tax=Laodelphax striatellus TaxID=195883 RepID=A0A482XNX6_LAOST|nr:hypothetical protein LSTR_LSTR009805 [Laodelphax striatellus]